MSGKRSSTSRLPESLPTILLDENLSSPDIAAELRRWDTDWTAPIVEPRSEDSSAQFRENHVFGCGSHFPGRETGQRYTGPEKRTLDAKAAPPVGARNPGSLTTIHPAAPPASQAAERDLRGKGWAGQAVECYPGSSPNSSPRPDYARKRLVEKILGIGA